MSVCSNFQGEPVDLKADIAVLHTLLDLRLVKRAYIAPAVVVHPGVGGIAAVQEEEGDEWSSPTPSRTPRRSPSYRRG